MREPSRGAAEPAQPSGESLVIVKSEATPPRFGRLRQARRLLVAVEQEIDTVRYDLGLDALPDMDEAAKRLLLSLPGMNPWNRLVGPFYRSAELRLALNVTEERFVDLIHNRDLLLVSSVDGADLLPTFQLDQGLELLPRLAGILQVIDPDAIDSWEAALWLNHHSAALATTPAEALRAGRTEDVARHAALLRPTEPSPGVLSQLEYPFGVYDSEAVASFLGMPHDHVGVLVAERILLAIPGSDGRTMFPAFQFGPEGQLLPGLREVLDELGPDSQGPEPIAGWFAMRSARLGQTPAGALRAGRLDEVLHLARSVDGHFR